MTTHLDPKVASVDIVTQEEIHAVLQGTAHFKQLHQVVLLAAMRTLPLIVVDDSHIDHECPHRLELVKIPLVR